MDGLISKDFYFHHSIFSYHYRRAHWPQQTTFAQYKTRKCCGATESLTDTLAEAGAELSGAAAIWTVVAVAGKPEIQCIMGCSLVSVSSVISAFSYFNKDSPGITPVVSLPQLLFPGCGPG